MNKVTTKREVRDVVNEWRREGLSVGLVTTMGFLHEGHGSLIERAVSENDRVVVTDFVNPIQFGPGEDLDCYPRDDDADFALCERIGADLIFFPSADEMYENPCTFVNIEKFSDYLCGAKRPGHFRGVCTVVTKFLNIVQPDRAYFGEKDAQQLAIITKMAKDLCIPVEIIGCPIIREKDGLAKSSRNTYLSEDERKAALCLSRAIKAGKEVTKKGINAEVVKDKVREVLEKEPLAKIDYIEAVSFNTMQPVESFDGDTLLAIAVYIGKTRLIDNFIFRI